MDFGSAEKAVRKYLAGYAEAEARLCAQSLEQDSPFAHGLFIPSRGEGKEIVSCLETIPPSSRGRVLTAVIVNADSESAQSVRDANQLSLESIHNRFGDPLALGPQINLHPHPSGALLVIDRATDALLARNQGVGLARKIGADILLGLIASGQIQSPWIHCSDADVRFPADYFEQIDANSTSLPAARLYRFRHLDCGDDAISEATRQYEISLRYSLQGLRFAHSPYAFHSIGSTLAIEASAYAKVRGFPRRMAAEDFYLLNKLAKIGPIETLKGDSLKLMSRISTRVPFGTGAAVGRLVENPGENLTTYDPLLYSHLRVWQRAIAHADLQQIAPHELEESVKSFADQDPRVEAKRLFAALEDTRALAGIQEALAAPLQNRSQRLHESFDGFRSLKLLHALRDGGLNNLPLRESLAKAPFIPDSILLGEPSFEQIAERMEAFEYENKA